MSIVSAVYFCNNIQYILCTCKLPEHSPQDKVYKSKIFGDITVCPNYSPGGMHSAFVNRRRLQQPSYTGKTETSISTGSAQQFPCNFGVWWKWSVICKVMSHATLAIVKWLLNVLIMVPAGPSQMEEAHHVWPMSNMLCSGGETWLGRHTAYTCGTGVRNDIIELE